MEVSHSNWDVLPPKLFYHILKVKYWDIHFTYLFIIFITLNLLIINFKPPLKIFNSLLFLSIKLQFYLHKISTTNKNYRDKIIILCIKKLFFIQINQKF